MNKKKIIALITLLISIAVIILLFVLKQNKEKEDVAIELANIPKFILYSLQKKQKDNGFFYYEFDFKKGGFSKTDNIIHQAEIALTMLDYLEKNTEDEKIKSSLHSLLNSLSNLLKNGKYGTQISFFQSDENDYQSLSFEQQEQKDKEFRAEIAATALTAAAMTRYRSLFSELDFAISEAVLIETLLKIAIVLNEQQEITDALFKYPSYEIWYAIAVYNHALPGNKEIKTTLKKLDKFFASVEGRIRNNNSLLYFLKTFLIRYNDEKSLYPAGAAIRNTRFFFNNYDNNYDSSVLSCLNVNILKKILKVTEVMDVDKQIQPLISRRISLALDDNKNFLIKPGQKWLAIGDGNTLNFTEIKKFAGFFISGYGNPVTAINNSSACFEAFFEE